MGRAVRTYTRREILRAVALGGGLVAGELWMPGRTLISVSSSGLLRSPLEDSDWWYVCDGGGDVRLVRLIVDDVDLVPSSRLIIGGETWIHAGPATRTRIDGAGALVELSP